MVPKSNVQNKIKVKEIQFLLIFPSSLLYILFSFSSVQSLSHVRLFATP